MDPKYLFLCAVGRSGTTILRTSLGLHPEFYYNNRENNIVQDLINVAHDNCQIPSRKFAMVVEQDKYNHIFRIAISDLLWPDTELRTRPVRMAAINATGDQLDYLCEVFPGAVILCLVRNGIEVVSSRTLYESFAAADFETHCNVWNRSLSVFNWGQSNPDQFRLIRHEWFYDPTMLTQQLNAIYDSLNVNHSQVPADHITKNLRHPTATGSTDSVDNFEHMSDEKKQAYFQSKSERWRDWTPQQRIVFQSKCQEFMDQLGYSIPWIS